MKKTTTLGKLLVLIFGSVIFTSTIVAQQATDARTTKTACKANVAATVQSKGNKQASDLPYYNYKGITDMELAKVTWKKDNPEAYRKWVQGTKATPSSNK